MLNKNQDSFIFELEYKSSKKSKFQLFHYNFINKNKDKCKIIYNEKEYDIMNYLIIDNNFRHNNSIKIQLKKKILQI